jgi:uncharacterized membrane protein
VKPLNWFGIILVYTALTLLSVYLIPEDSSLSVVRAALGYTFVVFVPGYCLVSLLFEESKLDFAEKLVLSVALSFSLVGISGLFLGLSPVGIGFASITETLGAMVVVLAVLAYLRKTGLVKIPSRKIRVQSPTQITS